MDVSPCVEKAIAIERKQKEGEIARARQLNRKRMVKHQCSPQTVIVHLPRSSVPSHHSTTIFFTALIPKEDRRPLQTPHATDVYRTTGLQEIEYKIELLG
jgi:hypothetical protein